MKPFKYLLLLLLLLIFVPAGAQEAKSMSADEIISRYNSGPGVLAYLSIAATLMLGIVLIYLFDIRRHVKMLQQKHEASLPAAQRTVHSSWFQIFILKGKDKDALQEDHVYDGIMEYDNNPPAWFNMLFFGTIGIAFCYLMYFHVLKIGALPLEEYTKQMAEAEVVVAKAQERAIQLAEKPPFTDAANLEMGKAIFLTNCAACHGDKGQGIIGPNLTDDYWLHGGEYKSVFKTIFNGVPEKGMLSWKKSLRPDELRAVASYVNTLKGTNAAGGKAPQGEKFVGDATASTE